MEIRDPVHHNMHFDSEERRILDHPWVQRLRHIRQLGFVSLVYPGAVHDRLQHSMGVCHVAGQAFDQLCSHGLLQELYDTNDLAYARRILRLAALLHDVGHAPFSHTAEEHLSAVEAFALPADWYRAGHIPSARKAHHEDCTLAVVAALAQSQVIAEDEARDICAVLSPHVRRSKRLAHLGSLVSLLRDLVSGELDADRCDYLLRDSHFCGVSYGLFDLPRLLQSMRVVSGPQGPELGIDGDGIHVFEGLLLARYHMFLQVYFHKTPPAFEYFLSQALAEGEIRMDLDAGLSDLLNVRDEVIVGRLHRAAAAGGRWSRRIIAREPARLVMRERVGEGDADNALSLQVINALQSAGCQVFWRQAQQRFTTLAGAGGQRHGDRLHCVRRVLGRTLLQSVPETSHLLSAFNTPIHVQYTYVLREDADRAAAIIRRMNLGSEA
ncbi:MAG: HD domain-containing protein [Planctomycetota bacterium]|nr:MAG: HD domain-containing protein [Planctomycetota bacterium]